MGGTIENFGLPKGVTPEKMALQDFEHGYNTLRDILLRLVNNRKNSKKYKEALAEAIDILSKPKITQNTWFEGRYKNYDDFYDNKDEIWPKSIAGKWLKKKYE